MRVKNFAGFMKTRTLNESDGFDDYNSDDTMSGYYGANPEEGDETPDTKEDGDDQPEEELTLEDLKSMIDDLSERVKKLEPEEEEEPAESEEEEEPAEEEESTKEK